MSVSWMLLVVIGLVAFYFVRMRSTGALGGQGQSTGRMEFDNRDEARRLLPSELLPIYDAALGRGDLRPLTEHFSQRTDWDARARLADAIGTTFLRSTWDAWCNNEPASPIPWLLRGAHGIDWAWDARGSGTGDTVTDEAQRLMVERLRQADSDLRQAAKLAPQDPTPWALRLRVIRGLSQGIEAAEQCFQEAIRRDPSNALAHGEMLTILTEKWNGSHAQMFEFARRVSAAAPRGSDLHMLLVRAHIERWLYEAAFEENKEGADAYLRNDDARAECMAAYSKSLASPSPQVRPSTIVSRNYAAFWFYMIENRELLRKELAQIGAAHTEYPWTVLGSSGDGKKARENFQAAQAWAAQPG